MAYPLFFVGFSEVSAFAPYELVFISGSLHNIIIIIGQAQTLLLQVN